MEMPKELFEEYKLQDYNKIKFRIEPERLLRGIAPMEEKVNLRVDFDKGKLFLGGGDITYLSGALTPEEEAVPELENLEFSNSFKVGTRKFYKSVRRIWNITDSVKVIVDDEVRLRGKRDDEAFEEIISEDFSGKEVTLSKYPSRYLRSLMMYAHKISDEVKVDFAEDYPMKIECGSFTFVVAPRVEDEGEFNGR